MQENSTLRSDMNEHTAKAFDVDLQELGRKVAEALAQLTPTAQSTVNAPVSSFRLSAKGCSSGAPLQTTIKNNAL